MSNGPGATALPPTSLKCALCCQEMNDPTKLKLHINLIHFGNYQIYKCRSCSFTFGDPTFFNIEKFCCDQFNRDQVDASRPPDNIIERLMRAIYTHSLLISRGQQAEVLTRTSDVLHEARTYFRTHALTNAENPNPQQINGTGVIGIPELPPNLANNVVDVVMTSKANDAAEDVSSEEAFDEDEKVSIDLNTVRRCLYCDQDVKASDFMDHLTQPLLCAGHDFREKKGISNKEVTANPLLHFLPAAFACDLCGESCAGWTERVEHYFTKHKPSGMPEFVVCACDPFRFSLSRDWKEHIQQQPVNMLRKHRSKKLAWKPCLTEADHPIVKEFLKKLRYSGQLECPRHVMENATKLFDNEGDLW